MNQGMLDIRNPIQKIVPSLTHWQGTNPNRDRIDFTNFYMKINGRPVFLAAGEIHPTRTCEEYWEESILKMKAGGLNTVSFYILWNHIEQRPGIFDFTGNRNIRRFVELCKEHGMHVWPRVGPFCNSEALHGGLPSWLYGQPLKERSNDPKYLFYVERLYKEIAMQFNGLLYKDGGPIISIQIENEYGHAPASWDTFYMYGAGPISTGDDGEAHMLKLKKLAIKSGLIVPFYSCTGWGSPIPKDEFLPMYGCYAYMGDCGPTNTSTFSVGPEVFEYPPAFVEIGGGAPTQRDWRPIIPPETVESGLFTRIACGANITGLYIYHGGTNPTSYDRFYVMYDNITLMSYDWNSPISEYGILRDAYYQARPLQQFLTGFSELFCPMVPVWQEKYIDPENTKDLRYMARVNGNSGFLFLNNFQDKLELPDRDDVKVELQLSNEILTIPCQDGLTLKSGVMVMLPFNLNIGGALLKYSTSQLLYKLKVHDSAYWIFFAPEGMKAEYAFDASTVKEITGVKVLEEKGFLYATPGTGLDSMMGIKSETEIDYIVTLTREQAERCVKTHLWGEERILYSTQDILSDDRKLRVSQLGQSKLSFGVFPEPKNGVHGPYGFIEGTRKGLFTFYETTVHEKCIKPEVIEYGKDKMIIKLSEYQFQDINDIYLKITYSGDIARLFADGLMVGDHIHDGLPWYIGLKRLKAEVCSNGLFLKLEPERDGFSKIVFDGITFHMTGQRVGDEPFFEAVEWIPEYYAYFMQ